MHHTVLVAPPPGDAGRDALALGVKLARPFGAQVVLTGVLGPADVPGGTLRAALEDLRASAPHDLPVSVETITAPSLMRGLHNLACAHDAELLVLGSTQRTLLMRALGRDLAAAAVFTAPCAVAVARSSEGTEAPQRIGVAWDESAEANEALEWAVQLAERTAGTVRILRALPDRGAEAGEHDTGLDAALRAAGRRVSAEAQMLPGDAAALLTEATRDVDVLVAGSRARGPVRRTLLGSVSTKLTRDARCAVVVLPRGVHAPLDTAIV